MIYTYAYAPELILMATNSTPSTWSKLSSGRAHLGKVPGPELFPKPLFFKNLFFQEFRLPIFISAMGLASGRYRFSVALCRLWQQFRLQQSEGRAIHF